MIGDLDRFHVHDIYGVATLSNYGSQRWAIAAFPELRSRPGLRHEHHLTTGYGKMFDNVEM